MKKFIISVVMAIVSVSAFAMGTCNIGVKTNEKTVLLTGGYDLLCHSFDKSELWIEPRIDIVGALNDNDDRAICLGFGMTLSNVYTSNNFLWAIDTDYVKSSLDGIDGITVGAKLGYKLYNVKLMGGIEKGWYFCHENDNRITGHISPWMLALGCEYFW